jgi:alpha,alpha-trehalase
MMESAASLPLSEYGVIGDLHTAALVSRHGSIDWLCWPRLDAAGVFAAILDPARGGRFVIRPDPPYRSIQSYEPSTNILRTRFTTANSVAQLTDFMPVETIDQEEHAFQEIHRVLEIERGTMRGSLLFDPRPDFGRAARRLAGAPHGVLVTSGSSGLALSTEVALQERDGAATASWSLRAGDRRRFVLRHDTHRVRPVDDYQTDAKLAQTRAFWTSWSLRCRYAGPHREEVIRSALTLKLLTYAPTGALAAAATTSLPEAAGGTRNWDYRFSWIRDSAYAMQTFHALGYTREARRYLRWLRRLLRGVATDADVAHLRVCYGLEGETNLPEEELGHLQGYLESRPVRIGNAANLQLQHDLHGSIVAAVTDAYQEPGGLPDEAWRTVRAIARHVCRHWQEPDHGIWEIRGPRRRYTHSALMSWVALSQASRIAQARGDEDSHERWSRTAMDIRAAIIARGWNPGRGSFVQALGGSELDASVLMIPLVGFLPPTDPRVRATMETVRRELAKGPFVYRYRTADGFPDQEGAFLVCSFWFIHGLALDGRVEEARTRFLALKKLAGPLGLFSEEVDPETLLPLGNFPQALTHIAQINAALALEAPHASQRPGSALVSPSTAG